VKVIHNTFCVVLVFWLLFSLIQIVLTFMTNPLVDENLNAVSSTDKNKGSATHKTASVDILQLQSLDLFGADSLKTEGADVVPVQDVIDLDATKTRLNVALEGIVLNSRQDESLAIIVYQGKQDQYYVGEKLPINGSVSLERVLEDHVILNNSGSYESLWLYDEENKTSSASHRGEKKSSPKIIPRRTTEKATVVRPDRKATSLAKDYRKRLYNNPRSLAEAIRISPSQKGGQLVGYKVSPGKDRQQFTDLGFMPNDVVTSINGITLDEPSKALEIYKLMRSAKEANFTVDRNGETLEIAVSLDDNTNS